MGQEVKECPYFRDGWCNMGIAIRSGKDYTNEKSIRCGNTFWTDSCTYNNGCLIKAGYLKTMFAVDGLKKIIVSDQRRAPEDFTPTYLAQITLQQINDVCS